jgi:hypothetical protein
MFRQSLECAEFPQHLVSNLNRTRMTYRRRFRWFLPASQVPLAALFGGWGLWLRDQILSHDYLFGTGWNSTARFHVWPWPFKFAVVTNTPAFLCWGLVSWPLGERWPNAPETAMAAPCLLFVALLWFAVGRWIDKHCDSRIRLIWGSLLGFTLICAAGAAVNSTTFYLVWGALVWIVVGCATVLYPVLANERGF